MAIIVETGAGIQGAESYATVAQIDSYWAGRTTNPNSSIWAALGTSAKESSLREATSYLDATYGYQYIGKRRGHVQGLLWPRSGALDSDGYPLPDLPNELVVAVAELSVRASSGTALAGDVDPLTMIVEEKKVIGPMEKTIKYADPTKVGGASVAKVYGLVDGILGPILQNGGGSGSWNWA